MRDRGALGKVLPPLIALALLLVASRAEAKYAPPPIAGHVTDTAGKLTPSEISSLNDKLASYRKCSSNHVAVFFPKSLEGNSVEDVLVRIAAGGDLPARQDEVVIIGHAIECRINAENPQTFRPSPGRILQYHPPGGLGVRIDSAVYQGYVIPPYYDSLVGKLIVHGKTRGECLMRLRRALDEMVVDGIETTLPLFRALVREPGIIDGDYHIHWLEQYLAGKPPVS